MRVYLRAPPTSSTIARILHSRYTLLPIALSLICPYLNHTTYQHNYDNYRNHRRSPITTNKFFNNTNQYNGRIT